MEACQPEGVYAIYCRFSLLSAATAYDLVITLEKFKKLLLYFIQLDYVKSLCWMNNPIISFSKINYVPLALYDFSHPVLILLGGDVFNLPRFLYRGKFLNFNCHKSYSLNYFSFFSFDNLKIFPVSRSESIFFCSSVMLSLSFLFSISDILAY